MVSGRDLIKGTKAIKSLTCRQTGSVNDLDSSSSTSKCSCHLSGDVRNSRRQCATMLFKMFPSIPGQTRYLKGSIGTRLILTDLIVICFSCHLRCPPRKPRSRLYGDGSTKLRRVLTQSELRSGPARSTPPTNQSLMNPFNEWILATSHWQSHTPWGSLRKGNADRIFMWRSGSILLHGDETTFTDVNNPFQTAAKK